MLSMPAMGALVSRYGCKRLIQFSAGAIFLGSIAASVAPSSALLALSVFLFGASIGAIDVVMNGDQAEVLPSELLRKRSITKIIATRLPVPGKAERAPNARSAGLAPG
jgi:MFS family permease